MHPRAALAASLVVFSAVTLSSPAPGAEDARDLNGVWQAFSSVHNSRRGANNMLTADGEIKVADFSARYPNMIEAASYCVPAGMPSAMTAITGDPMEITQNTSRITMASGTAYRRVFLDGRDYPETVPATRMGYSIGKWEGSTLVVETRFLSEMLAGNFPRTTESIVVERISKTTRSQVTAPADAPITEPALDDTVLAFAVTITDASLYREPQTVTVYYQHVADNAMTESDCLTNLWLQALEDANP